MRMDEWPMTVSSRLGSTQGERLRGSGRRAGGHVGTVFGARIGLFALAVFARFTAPRWRPRGLPKLGGRDLYGSRHCRCRPRGVGRFPLPEHVDRLRREGNIAGCRPALWVAVSVPRICPGVRGKRRVQGRRLAKPHRAIQRPAYP